MNDRLQRAFQKKLAELRSKYLQQVAATAEELSTLSLDLGDTADVSLLRGIHRHAHSLAGSAPTFGFPAMGQSARDLERLIAPHLSGDEVAPVDVDEVVGGVAAVCSAAWEVARGQGDGSMAARSGATDDAQSPSRRPR